MPDDDLESPDDVLDNSSSRPEARQRKKALDFANKFIRALDVLVLSELAALYYADCVTTTLILRSLVQVFLSPPVNTGLSAQVPNPRPHLSLILFATFLSILLHVFGGRPAADERGYLHGGVLIDFVGFPARTSILQLIFFDLVIGFLQLLTLTATIIRHGIKEPTTMRRPQDHSAEERGVRRSTDSALSGVEVPENADMPGLMTEAGLDTQPTSVHPLDRYYSGDMIVLDLNILEIKRQLAFEPASRVDTARMRAAFGTLLSRRFHAPST